MVTRWRDEIGLGDIPFYAVEIAPYEYDSPAETGKSPYLREAQWKAVSMIPNADMICINDLVEPYERYNIHPAQKEAVGRRLCDLALNKTYGKKQFLAGSPRYKSHRTEGDKMLVAIESPNDGVCRNYDIVGFEIAGADGVFHPAENVNFRWQTNEVEPVVACCPCAGRCSLLFPRFPARHAPRRQLPPSHTFFYSAVGRRL